MRGERVIRGKAARGALAVAAAAFAFMATSPATAAVTGSAEHDYTADGTTADADGGTSAQWNGTPAYVAGHTGSSGDEAFSVSPTATLSVPGDSVGDVGTANFGLSVWVKLADNGSDEQEILAKRPDCTSGDAFLDLRAGSDYGGVMFELQDANNPAFHVVNAANVLDDTWHHIVAIRRGDTVTLAVDGQAVSGTTTGVVDMDNTASLEFDSGGCAVTGGDGTTMSTGAIDDVQLGPAPSPGTTVVPSSAPPSTAASHPAQATHTAPPTTHATASGGHHPTASKQPRPRPSRHGATPTTQPSAKATAKTSIAPTTQPRAGRPSTRTAASRQIEAARATHERLPAVAFDHAVPTLQAAFGSVGTVGRNFLLAAILLALLGLPVSLVNRTAVVHADELAALTLRVRRRLPSVRTNRRLPDAGLLLAAAVLSGVLYGFLEPTFAFTMSSLALVLGLIVGLSAIVVTKELVRAFVLRRAAVATKIRFFPGFVILGVGCVLVSRLTGLQPGLLLGTFVGVATVRQLRAADDGPALRAAYLGIAIVVVGALGVRGLLQHHETGPESFGITIVDTALAAVIASGVEAMAFELIPLRFLHGYELFAWSKLRWFPLFLLGLFGFVDLLLHPSNSDQDLLHHAAYLGRLVAIYFVVAFGFWGWFRFRPERFKPHTARADSDPG